MKSMIQAAALSMAVAAGAVCDAAAQTAPAAAESVWRATTLNLSAYGEVHATPDMATISLGVLTDAPTAAGAMSANAARMTQIMAALKKAGVAAKDIQTSGLNLNPQYVYEQNVPPRLTGYQVSSQVTVIVRDLNALGGAVDACVKAGANQVNGISFGINDPTAAENAARLDAAKALQAKADLYAKAMGYRVSRLVSLSEGGGYSAPPPTPMPMVAMARADKSEAMPVAPGELRVRMDVSGYFELAK